MEHLKLPSIDWLKEHLAIDPEMASGLKWIKKYVHRKPGQMAGCLNTNGYYQVRIKGKLYLAHRLIYYIKTGIDPADKVIDHIYSKHNHLDIREATYVQNAFYAKHVSKSTTSQYKGVTWDRNKWKARITYANTLYDLGRFDDEIEAAKAYDIKALELDPQFAFLNFPGQGLRSLID